MQDKMPDHETLIRRAPPVPDDCIAPIDAIQRAMTTNNARVVAITTAREQGGINAISRMLSTSLAAGDVRTLLVDATQPGGNDIAHSHWEPGDPIPSRAMTAADGAASAFDTLVLNVTPATRPLFNNQDRLRSMFHRELAGYQAVVVCLPPVLTSDSALVNPVSMARIADATFLICHAGRTQTKDAKHTVDTLRESGVTLAGAILDNSERHLPGPEIAQWVESRRWMPGFLKRRLSSYFRTSALFNA